MILLTLLECVARRNCEHRPIVVEAEASDRRREARELAEPLLVLAGRGGEEMV